MRLQLAKKKLLVTFRDVRLSASARGEEAKRQAAALRLGRDEAPKSLADERGHRLSPGLGHRPHLPLQAFIQKNRRALHMTYAIISIRRRHRQESEAEERPGGAAEGILHRDLLNGGCVA